MNLFLFPSITVFYYFCSFKCLFASNCSHSSYKRFHSPGPAAGSCCPDCPHPQDPTSLELQRGLAIWQDLPCCSQHLLELAECWGESPLCTRLALVLARITVQGLELQVDVSRCSHLGLSRHCPCWIQPGFAGSPEVWELLVLVPSFLLQAQQSGQCQQSGLFFGMAGVPEVGQSCYPVMALMCKQHLQLWPILGAV